VPYNNSLQQTNKHRLQYFVLTLLLFITSSPLLAITNNGLSTIRVTNDSSFSAILTTNGVYLNWARTNEETISHYTIEKSIDKTVTLDIVVFFTSDLAMEPKSLEASATTLQVEENTTMKTYKFKDAPAAKSNRAIYYRLKTVDKKGVISYSAWRTIEANKK
jgi:hypothetical protein